MGKSLYSGHPQCYHYAVLKIAGSNPAEALDVCLPFSVCCGGSNLCDKMITHSEESYQVCKLNCARTTNLNNDAA